MSLKKSYPFIHGQQVISFDANGKVTRDNTYNGIFDDLKEDKSYQIVMRLHDSVYAKDIEGFKKIYEEEYINNTNIVDFFKFDEEEHDWWFNTYRFCRCVNKDDDPDRIHRHMYVRPCNCSNGKRYLAYLCAYNAQQDETTYYYDTTCNETNKNISDIQQYLLDDGPIDLKYTNLLYNGTSDLKYTNLVYNKNK
jgi:hypothetical protein